MNRLRPRRLHAGSDDATRGAAALELALMFTLLFAVLAIVLPLATALLAKIRLERAAGATVRFATETPDRTRPGTTSRRPTAAEICADAQARYAEIYESATVGCTVTFGGSKRRSGQTVTVRISATRDLGAFGWITSSLGLGTQDIDLAATSTARQE